MIYNSLVETLGKDIEPVFGFDRAGDIKHSNADISLEYGPLNYDFKSGLNEAIEWYKGIL